MTAAISNIQRRRPWTLERTLFAMAGSVTLAGVALGVLVSPWFLLLTGFVGAQPVALLLAGDCPASLVLRRFTGLRGATDERPRPDRAPRPLDGRRTSAPSLIAWAVVAVGLGVLAPRVETRALRRRLGGHRLGVGGGARAVDASFGGLRRAPRLMVVVHSATRPPPTPPSRPRSRGRRGASSPPTRAWRRSCRPRPASRSPPTATPRSSGRRRGRARTRWCAPPTTSSGELAAAGGDGVDVSLTGASGHVVGLQRGQPRRDDEVRADLLAGHAGDPACSRSARWSPPACR